MVAMDKLCADLDEFVPTDGGRLSAQDRIKRHRTEIPGVDPDIELPGQGL